MKTKIFRFLEKQPKGWNLGLSLGFSLLIGLIDYFVKLDISLSIFYLFPIVLSTWFLSFQAGISISLLCTFCWFQADIAAKTYVISLLPYWNAAVRLGFFLIVSYLLSSLQKAYLREQTFARIDSLTGSNNRRFFYELLERELQRSRRYSFPLTLAYLDIDNFKFVNDRWGHSAGDRLLQDVAQTLKDGVRVCDVVARLGGDEFAILLPQTDEEQAKSALTRLHDRLQTVSETTKFPISFSMGAVIFSTLPDSGDLMLDRADRLMYSVKHSGKNRLEFCQYTENR